MIVPEKEDGEKSEGKSKEAAVVVRVPSAMVVRRKESEAAARRAMAIKRLREMDEEEEAERVSLREFAMFPTARGDVMFTQSWTPVAIQTK